MSSFAINFYFLSLKIANTQLSQTTGTQQNKKQWKKYVIQKIVKNPTHNLKFLKGYEFQQSVIHLNYFDRATSEKIRNTMYHHESFYVPKILSNLTDFILPTFKTGLFHNLRLICTLSNLVW